MSNDVFEISNGFEEDDAEDSIKINKLAITSYNIDRPIETLVKWKENGKLEVPDFQRDFVWENRTACKLIDSVLLGLPIPGIFVFKYKTSDGNEKFKLIDGLQRITTLEQFKNGRFVSKEKRKDQVFKILMKNSAWHLKTFNDLSLNDQENFLDYSINVTVFENTDKNGCNDMNSMYEIFERINTGSEKLTNQEIRNAIYPGKLLNEIKEYCASNKNYKKIIEVDTGIFKRKKEQELLLRCITYCFLYNKIKLNDENLIDGIDFNFSTSKIEMLNSFLYYGNDDKIDYKTYFDKVKSSVDLLSNQEKCEHTLCSITNGKTSKHIHEVFMEALLIAISEVDIKTIDCVKLNEWKEKNWNTENFRPFFQSTTNKDNITKRVDIIKNFINEI